MPTADPTATDTSNGAPCYREGRLEGGLGVGVVYGGTDVTL